MNMEMLFSAGEKRLLRILANAESPWDIFVSKSDFKEPIPEVPSRKKFLEEITDLFADTQNSLIIPIISDIGIGKTHFLWAINESVLIDYSTLFFKMPSANSSFYYSLYTQLIKNIDRDTFQNALNLLSDTWGANRKIYGLFRIGSPEKIAEIIESTKARYRASTEHLEELADCITVIVKFAMDRNRYKLCERWILGDYINFEDLLYIGVKRDLSAPHMAKEMLKLLLEGLRSSIVIMIDDFLKAATRYDEEIIEVSHENGDEDDEYYDFNGFPDEINNNQNNNYIILQETTAIDHNKQEEAQMPIYDRLKELIQEFKGIKLILTMHLEELQPFLNKIPEDLKQHVNVPFVLQPFSKEDFKWFYIESFNRFCHVHRIHQFSDNPFFPLNEAILDTIYDKCNGNPRMMIKQLKSFTEAFLKNIIERIKDV